MLNPATRGAPTVQSQLSAVEHQMGDVTLEPSSEEDESEDWDEDEDEDWVWRSAGAHLTKRCNSQVRLRSVCSCLPVQSADRRSLLLSSPTGRTCPERRWCPTRPTKL